MYFKQNNIKFDSSVYRNGMGKFRMIMFKKEGDKNSVLIPITFKDEFKKHLIQNIDDCESLEITKDNIKVKIFSKLSN